MKKVWKIIKGVAVRFTQDDPTIYAAAIAFFTIFSLPSILSIVIYTMGSLFGEEAIRGEISAQINDLVGEQSAEQVEKIIENAMLADAGIFSTILSIFFLLFSATVIFNIIQKALNSIWGVKPKPKQGAVKFARDRALSFVLVLILGSLLLVTILSDTAVTFFRDLIDEIWSPATTYIIRILNFLVSFALASLIFAITFKVLPDAKVRWKAAWVGAIFTAVLFSIGKIIIGLILTNTDITSTYGAAGSTIGILLFVFYSSIIFMIGGEFTEVYSEEFGKAIRPKKHSVWVKKEEVEFEHKSTTR